LAAQGNRPVFYSLSVLSFSIWQKLIVNGEEKASVVKTLSISASVSLNNVQQWAPTFRATST
jgi:hypothetical protein